MSDIQEVPLKICYKCGDNIHPKRLKILPTTRICVKCSTTDKLVGVPIAIGKGEDIYNDLNIMTQESFKEFSKLQKHLLGNGGE